ncbi:MAG: FAD-dependent oxidoreductase [Candidatus Bathyarchaeia archaeon]
MIKISDLTTKLDVWDKKDVVVVGGGTAGVAAALAARRNGADTLIIERESCLGGMMTNGFVIWLNNMRGETPGNPLLTRGIGLEIFRRLAEVGGTQPPDEKGEPIGTAMTHQMDPVILAQLLEEMMEEGNVEVLYNTIAFDAVVEDNAVKGVAFANKAGAHVVLADVVVDCSGDADIAVAAGAPYVFGRKKDGRTYGGGLWAMLGGIDPFKLIEFLKTPPSEEELASLEKERTRLFGYGAHFNWETTGHHPERPIKRTWEEVEKRIKEGTFGVVEPTWLPDTRKILIEWMKYVKEGRVPPWYGSPKLIYPFPWFSLGLWRHGKMRYDQALGGLFECWFNQADPVETSKAIFWMRKMNKIFIDFLRERIPGFENAYIIIEAPTLPTRESRRIIGEYILTEQDAIEAKRFPDVIGKSGSGFIIKRPFDIPYRVLLPKNIDNIIVAGRCVSVDDAILGHGFRFVFRCEGVCLVLGEAAGTAAALSSRLGVSPKKLDVKLLQKTLLEQGALLFLEDEKEREEEVRSYTPLYQIP